MLTARTWATVLLAVCAIAFVPSLTEAQDDPTFEQGFRPYAAYHGGDIDSVNLSNGGLSLNIPLVSYPQRGKGLGLEFALKFVDNGFFWSNTCEPAPIGCITNWYSTAVPYSTPCEPEPIGCSTNGVQGIHVIDAKDLDYHHGFSVYTVGNGVNSAPHTVHFFGIREPDGSYHQAYQTLSGSYETVDGSAYRLDLSTCTITDRQGSRYQQYNPAAQCPTGLGTSGGSTIDISGSQLREDANGNRITVSPSGWVDTLGRQIPAAQATSDYSGCTGNLPVTRALLWNLPGYNGGTYPVKLCYGSVPLNVGCSAGTSKCNGIHTTIEQLQSVVLQNNRTAWTFTFDLSGGYGDLLQITFPTGATLSYTWMHGTTCAGPGTNYAAIVSSRTIDNKDGSGAHTWTYSYASNYNQLPFAVTTTVSDPLLNDTVHTNTDLATLIGAPHASCGLYETKAQNYQGPSSSGSLLKTETTDYTYHTYNYGTSLIGIFPIRNTLTWANGQVSKTEQDPDGGFTFKDPDTTVGTTYQTTYGRTIADRTYDYASGSSGPLLRQTKTTYMALSGPNASPYLSNNLLTLPYTVQVLDGSGIQRALTQYNYDETSRASSGLTSSNQWDSAPPTGNYRGNNTSIYSWLNSGSLVCPNGQSGGSGSNIIATRTYFDDGMLSSSADPCKNTTSHAYSLNYWAAFPTTSTNPLGQSTVRTYDFNSGLLASTTDSNSRTTSYGYDLMWRLSQITYPDGGQTAYCYSDIGGSTCSQSGPPFQLVTTKLISSTAGYRKATTQHDGLGRVTQTQLNSDPDGITYTDTTYDAVGRVASVSNPYRSTSDSTYGKTSYYYDALSRPCLLVPPDGTLPSGSVCPSAQPSNTVFTTYSGNTSTITDQAGKSRKSITDGLGRLQQVFEDPLGLNYETDYSYDALGNLACAAQKGTNTGSFSNCGSTPGAWRPRSYTYDSLSRLTQAVNPESGTVNYAYDPNSNLLSKTAPAPNQTGTSTVLTCYGDWTGTSCSNSTGYDALNRLLKKSYSDGTTPTVRYAYDGAALSGCTTTPPTLTDSNPVGNRTSMCDGAGAESWSHDSMGRILSDSRTTNGSTYTFSYTYNLDGSLLTRSGFNETTNYAQGGAGRPLSVVGTFTYAKNLHYTPAGALCYIQQNWDGTWTTTSTFNNRQQPATIHAVQNFNGTDPPVCAVASPYPGNTGAGEYSQVDLSYSFTDASGHNNGNVASISNVLAPNRSQTFSYDSLNRLATAQTTATHATDASDCWAESYSYDAWGNLLNNAANPTTQSAYTGCSVEVPASLTSVVQSNNTLSGFGYTTDAAGNLVADGVHTFTFDAENHLLSTTQSGTTVSYKYDGDGKRVSKSSGAVYWYDPNGNIINDYMYTYYYMDGKRLARHNAKNEVDFFLTDHLGSTRYIFSLDSTGSNAAPSASDFYPFGGERVITTGANPTPYKFTGKERDPESGDDNFGSRYLTSSLGRFISPDKVLVDQKTGNPQSWNLFSFVRNNPTNNTDPDGLACVQGSDGKFHDDNSGGQSCADAARDNSKTNPSAIVTAKAPKPDLPPLDSRNTDRLTFMLCPQCDWRLGGLTVISAVPKPDNHPLHHRILGESPFFPGEFNLAERELLAELEALGFEVKPIARSNVPGEKTADIMLNGVETEIKIIESSGDTTIKNAIQRADKQTFGSIIIDARKTTLGAADALAQIERAQGNIGGLQGRVFVFTKEGVVKY